jgi:septal ring factor EnvC (AmiA/AmiB activator)
MKTRNPVLLIFAMSILMGPLHPCRADEFEERRNQLDAIREELTAKRALQDSLGRRERSASTRLQDIEEQVALSGQLLLKLDRESKKVNDKIRAQKLQLEITSLQHEQREEILKRRLRAVYKVGNLPGWLEIISAENPTSALAGLRNMKTIMQYDRSLLESYRQLTKVLENGLAKYRANVADLAQLREQQKEELAIREKTMKTRKALVNKLRKDKKEVQRSISKLEDDATEIAGILERLQRERIAADTTLAGLEERKGNLIWPTRGKILRPFGRIADKRGIVLSNPGIDIQAVLGADVVSAAPGVVAHIDWLRGYGQFIIVDHGRGYYTLYANLSDVLVETGEKVGGGELIGLVGDSGSLEGAKLHFEVRRERDQLNPAEWLR